MALMFPLGKEGCIASERLQLPLMPVLRMDSQLEGTSRDKQKQATLQGGLRFRLWKHQIWGPLWMSPPSLRCWAIWNFFQTELKGVSQWLREFMSIPSFSFLFSLFYLSCVCAHTHTHTRAHQNTCGGQRMIQWSPPVTPLPLSFLCVFGYFAGTCVRVRSLGTGLQTVVSH